MRLCRLQGKRYGLVRDSVIVDITSTPHPYFRARRSDATFPGDRPRSTRVRSSRLAHHHYSGSSLKVAGTLKLTGLPPLENVMITSPFFPRRMAGWASK
jgi:hypothetical protein